MTAAHPPSLDTGNHYTAPENADPVGSLLVVDDDALVLRLLRLWLPRMGFAVWAAEGGKAAVSIYERQRDQIDLVLLDVCMPGMDGPATLRELRRLNADVPSCFMSGYTGQYTEDMLKQMGTLALYEKPFNLEELAQSLRRIVGHVRLRKTA